MGMKVIGAGLPRTATTTQMFALEHLGFGPCYHMRDLLADLEVGLPLWEAAFEGNADWDAIFDGDRVSSTVDWRSAYYYRQLLDYYPDAKVLLSARDADAWVKSMRGTIWAMFHDNGSAIHHVSEARAAVDPLWRRYLDLMNGMNWAAGTGAFDGDHASDEGLAATMIRWNNEVKASVPADRLLAWDPSEGWEPLCEFLEVDVPADPLPRLNDTHAFREGIIGGGIASVNTWWDARERPSESLHGAAVTS
ncbi:MAG TPA: sulfotransferase [Solirubrobacteraceae bacterium]|nr:sulfotransferase [Solirubrobacteraceae bacterium]